MRDDAEERGTDPNTDLERELAVMQQLRGCEHVVQIIDCFWAPDCDMSEPNKEKKRKLNLRSNNKWRGSVAEAQLSLSFSFSFPFPFLLSFSFPFVGIWWRS